MPTCPSAPATFSVTAAGTGPFTYRWQTQIGGNWLDLADGPRDGADGFCADIAGSGTATLTVSKPPRCFGAGQPQPQSMRVIVTNACGSVTSNPATLTICVADTDDGTGAGVCDGGVTIDDLLYYLGIFDQGVIAADVDDGTATGTPDGGVTIDDLLYYLFRFDSGC